MLALLLMSEHRCREVRWEGLLSEELQSSRSVVLCEPLLPPCLRGLIFEAGDQVLLGRHTGHGFPPYVD